MRYRAVALPLILLTPACQAACPTPPASNTATTLPGDGARFLASPVSYCWSPSNPSPPGQVQILVDASGSMVGFKQTMPRLIDWLRNSISALNQSVVAIQSLGMCQFSVALPGVAKCQPGDQALANYEPRGNTNLHEAIAAASNADLTYILTDGIAATGSLAAAGCANGVDASCVARALRATIEGSSSSDGLDRGIWVVPLVAEYSGRFFTEQPVPPSQFQPNVLMESIRQETNTQVQVQNAQTGSDGTLIFDYQGPRHLLLIIIASRTALGRAAGQTMWDRRSGFGIAELTSVNNLPAGIAMSPPIEVYPGWVPQIGWRKLEALSRESPELLSGTIGASLGSVNTVSLGCAPGVAGRDRYRLSGAPLDAGKVSGCAPLLPLPAFYFKLAASSPADDPDLSTLVGGSSLGDTGSLLLDLTCPSEGGRACGPGALRARWAAEAKYGLAADCLNAGNCSEGAAKLILDISTLDLSRQAHRIFGLHKLLEAFYGLVTADSRSFALSDLNLCTS